MAIITVGDLKAQLENWDDDTKICIQVQARHRIYARVSALDEHEDNPEILVLTPGREEYSAEALFD